MKFSGQIRKMASVLGEPIQYFLNLGNDVIAMNQCFGKNFKMKHIGFQCVECGKDQPIFRMGFCKKCFFESPYASETIIRPELSKAHLGVAERDLAVEQEIQLQPHIVYLAHTGDTKVGVTRETQIPTRWIDQGATFALPIAKTTNRYEAGMIEIELKRYLNDKTNYRKMLSDDAQNVDLENIRNLVKAYFPKGFEAFYLENEAVVRLDFPSQKPEKVNVFTLEKNPTFEGKLLGIKGQYLHFDSDQFINIRGQEGYVIDLEINGI